MEIDQALAAFALYEAFSPPLEYKDGFDEVLSQSWIMKAALIFHGEQGKVFHKGARK
jgi:hypothetical protein